MRDGNAQTPVRECGVGFRIHLRQTQERSCTVHVALARRDHPAAYRQERKVLGSQPTVESEEKGRCARQSLLQDRRERHQAGDRQPSGRHR